MHASRRMRSIMSVIALSGLSSRRVEARRTSPFGRNMRSEELFSPEIRRSMDETPKPPDFTDRQLEVLQSVVDGLGNKEIASKLKISTDAVKQHLNAICTKLGASNRVEAVSIALRRHLLRV